MMNLEEDILLIFYNKSIHVYRKALIMILHQLFQTVIMLRLFKVLQK